MYLSPPPVHYEMKKVAGVWLPADETHLTEFLEGRALPSRIVDGRGTYQLHKLEAALPLVKNWRAAVDVGAHVGLWAVHLAARFAWLHCFEPVPAHAMCLVRNLPQEMRSILIHQCALGAVEGETAMACFSAGSSGDTRVALDADVRATADPVPMRRLDSLHLADVDFMKIDCEGYELFVLQGAEETLARCRPVVVVEQKPGKAEHFGLGRTDAVTFLEGLGAKLRREISGDFILSWD